MRRFTVSNENIKAVKDLIVVYRSITSYKIQRCPDYKDQTYSRVLDSIRRLTGFGAKSTCTVCSSVNLRCYDCIHSSMQDFTGDCVCYHHNTFRGIVDCSSIRGGVTALNKRADYLELLLSEYEKEA